jgi:hypothetical protein
MVRTTILVYLLASSSLLAAEPQPCLDDLIDRARPKALSIDEVRRLGGEGAWRVYGRNPVISTGSSGDWDAGALGSMTVLRVGELCHLYYEAWGVRTETTWNADEYASLQIGHAVSLDGVNWIKDPANPVVPSGPDRAWDHSGTWDPFVIYEDGKFKMWYGGGGGTAPCDWAYAESADGSTFVKRGRISHIGHVEDIHVVSDRRSGKYWLYYWDRRFEPNGLYRAESATETGFDFDAATPIKIGGEDDDEMFKFTQVLRGRNGWLMFYGDFLRSHCPNSWVRLATSPDGIQWTARNKRLVAGHDGEVLRFADDLYLMYYGPRGRFDAKNCDIRLAAYRGDIESMAVE